MRMGDYIKIPYDEITKPKENHKCMINRYWLTVDGCVLGWKKSNGSDLIPQCNTDICVVAQIASRTPGQGMLFLPVAYWPIF